MRRVSAILVMVLLPATAGADERPWGIEATAGLVSGEKGSYHQRLVQFGYDRRGMVNEQWSVAATRRVHRHFELGVELMGFGDTTYWRDDTVPTVFGWDGHAVNARVRPLVESENGVIAAFLEGGVGLGWATSDFSMGPDAHDTETQLGPTFALGAGARAVFGRRGGLVLRVHRVWAPVLENLYGETQDVGGMGVDVGVRVVF
jgi:hypothetical protein